MDGFGQITTATAGREAEKVGSLFHGTECSCKNKTRPFNGPVADLSLFFLFFCAGGGAVDNYTTIQDFPYRNLL